MDTTGTFGVYKVLSNNKMITAMNKFYTVDDYNDFLNDKNNVLNPDFFMVSTGISDNDFVNLKNILSQIECNWIYVLMLQMVIWNHLLIFVNVCEMSFLII